ncbi:hypothetical protein [Shouchella miscanthi]|uniref:Uncharacterized protein n=1 Tax=Shouchella miscanthi TaxID=2598861 RepID=A0ABU6NJ76_9BACI|nr:hypothetical protein [Shouchella miscanthi]
MKYYLIDLERSISLGRIHYWKPNKQGYTIYIIDAGQYTQEEAKRLVMDDIDKITVCISVEKANSL